MPTDDISRRAAPTGQQFLMGSRSRAYGRRQARCESRPDKRARWQILGTITRDMGANRQNIQRIVNDLERDTHNRSTMLPQRQDSDQKENSVAIDTV